MITGCFRCVCSGIYTDAQNSELSVPLGDTISK